MKRKIAFALVLAMLFGIFAILPAHAADSADLAGIGAAESEALTEAGFSENADLAETAQTSGDYDYFLRGTGDNAYAVITDCRAAGNVTIPEKLDGYTVWEIEWSDKARSFSTVTIQNDAHISGSFNSAALTKVIFKQNAGFSGNIFGNCPKLTSVVFKEYYHNTNGVIWCGDDTIDSIEVAACLGGTSGKVALPDAAQRVVEEAFAGCTKLTGVNIPAATSYIGTDAFINCTNLKDYTIYSKNLTFESHSVGYRLNGGSYQKVDGVVISGYAGSSAQTYAKNNGFTFKTITAQAPAVTSLAPVEGGVSISWKTVEGFSRYAVYCRDNDCDPWNRLATVSGATFVDKTIKPGVRRFYTVRCIDTAGNIVGEYDTEGRSISYAAAPVIKLVTNSRYTDGSFIFVTQSAYDPTFDSDDFEYVVYRTVNGKRTEIPEVSYPESGDYSTYDDKSIAVGTTCTYTAYVRNSRTDELLSSPSAAVKYTHTAVPKITSMTNLKNGIALSWSSVNGAVKYRLFFWKSGKWNTLATVGGTSYTDYDVSAFTSKKYTVRAIGRNGKFLGGYCNTLGLGEYNDDSNHPNAWIKMFTPPITIGSLSNTKYGVRITVAYPYGKYTLGVSVIVYRRENGGSWKMLDVINGVIPTYTDRTVIAGRTYTYAVRSKNDTVYDKIVPESAYIGGKSITASGVNFPAVTSISAVKTGLKLTWNSYPKAKKYAVFFKKDNQWKRIATVSGTSCIDTAIRDAAISSGKHIAKRTYTVRAMNAAGKYISSYHSGGWYGTFISEPSVTSLKKVRHGVQISVDLPGKLGEVNNGLNGYGFRIYRKENGGSWKQIAVNNGMTDFAARTTYSCIDTDAKAGNTYTYTVRIWYNNPMTKDSVARYVLTTYNNGKSITL